MRLQVKVLRSGVEMPRYATSGSVGLDLHAAIDKPIVFTTLHRELIPTGLAVAIPEGYEGQIRARSGWAASRGLTVLNSPGTIDTDFHGEIRVLAISFGYDPFTVRPNDRIAQLVVVPIARVDVVAVKRFSKGSVRGRHGFGSTGD